MTKPTLPKTPRPNHSSKVGSLSNSKNLRRKTRRSNQNSDVLISAVVSSYLLTHLHHVLQRAEYGAVREGRDSQAANFAQLRKVLCMDARSMKDASALGLKEEVVEKKIDSNIEQKVA